MNAWQQIQWIATESLMHLEDSLVITQLTAKDKTADFNVKPNGYAIGSSVDIKSNPVFEAKEFAGSIDIQGIRSSKRSMEIEKHFDVSVAMTAKEKRLDMASFSDEVIKPAIYAIAEKCDRYVASKITQAAGLYSSASLFGTAADMALAKKAATFQQLSSTNRFCLVDDTLEASLLGATFFNTYNNRGESGELVFNEASLGRAMGMGFFSSLNFPEYTHTAGDGVGASKTTPTGTENTVGTSVLVLEAAATGTFNDGDRIIVAGMRRPLIVNGTQATPSSINLVDPIAELVPANAAVTVVSTGATFDARGAIFDDRSMAFAAPMLDPASDKPSAVFSSNGYSIRVVQGYDMDAKTETISFDILCGAANYDPRRITLLGDNQ